MYFAIVDEHGVGSTTRRTGQDASVIPHILPEVFVPSAVHKAARRRTFASRWG